MYNFKYSTRLCLALIIATCLGHSARAVDFNLTLDNVTVNPNATVSMNVNWSSTEAIDYLTTEFIITPEASAPAGETWFSNTPIDLTTGTPDMPPLNNTGYVFYGDSDDFISLYPNNPASVSTTNWTYDTYNIADSTNSGNEYTQNGTRAWTILQIKTSSLAAGSYRVTLGSSQYTNAANVFPNGLVPTITGGLITVNSVPEPSTWILATIAIGILTRSVRCKMNHA